MQIWGRISISPSWRTEIDFCPIFNLQSIIPLLKVYQDSTEAAYDPALVSWTCPLKCCSLVFCLISEQKDSSVIALLNNCHLVCPLLKDLTNLQLFRYSHSKIFASLPASEEQKYCYILNLANHLRSWHLNKPSEPFPREFHCLVTNCMSTPLRLLGVPKPKMNITISQFFLSPPLLKLLMLP